MTYRRLTGNGLSRRAALKGAATLGGLALASNSVFAPAVAQTRRKVTMVYGGGAFDLSADAFMAAIPMGFGFFAEEGIEVEVQAVAGAAAATNMLASGAAQFTTHGSGGIYSSVGRGVPMKTFICQVVDYFTSIGVPKDGPVQSFEDLKGKIVGVPAAGGAPALIVKAAMRKLGLNPDKDIEFIAVGTSLPALEALRRNRVQALVAWDSVFALFEYHGGNLKYFRPPPIPQLAFTHITNTLNATIEKEPVLVAGMARAMAKSLVVMAAAEPAELARLHFKTFPASKPTGMTEEEILKLDGLRLAARKQFMRLPERVFQRSQKIGDAADEDIAQLRDLLHQGGEIPEALPVDRYFTRQFIEHMNAIDVAGLIARARGFKA